MILIQGNDSCRSLCCCAALSSCLLAVILSSAAFLRRGITQETPISEGHLMMHAYAPVLQGSPLLRPKLLLLLPPGANDQENSRTQALHLTRKHGQVKT